MLHDTRSYIQGATSIAWCHSLEEVEDRKTRVLNFAIGAGITYQNIKTQPFYVEQEYPAIAMIEQLITCA
jgi:hypothetical protein